MKSFLFVVILFGLKLSNLQAQLPAEITYYTSENLQKRTSKEKAKFSKTITTHPDDAITTEVRDLRKDEVIYSETWKGSEPYGIWISSSGNGFEEKNYDFPIVYEAGDCPDLIGIYNPENVMKNDAANHYRAPQLTDKDSTLIPFLQKNLRYPSYARENGIEGKVVLRFIITKTGDVTDVVIINGVETSLDKEAARVARKMQFLIPPAINGEPHAVCVKLPITFKLGH